MNVRARLLLGRTRTLQATLPAAIPQTWHILTDHECGRALRTVLLSQWGASKCGQCWQLSARRKAKATGESHRKSVNKVEQPQPTPSIHRGNQ